MIEALGVGSYPAFQDTVIGMSRNMGAGWARVDFWWDGSKFIYQDGYIERLKAAGFEVVGSARLKDNFLPADLVKFEAGLRELVQRYPSIKIWQVGNEPNISLVYPDEYPRLFLTGVQVVRDLCPSCRVMLAGVAARWPSEAQAQEIYRRALAEISAACGADRRPFDIFDVHFYATAGNEGELRTSVADYRRLISQNGFDEGIEIWLTESATYTGSLTDTPDSPIQTEDQQAAELVRRFVTGLAAGLSRVSWARPYENYRYGGFDPDGIFDNSALIYNGLGQESGRGIKAGTAKKSWFAYRTLVSKVKGYEEIRNLAPGIYEFRFGGGRPSVFVAWDAGSATTPGPLLPAELRGEITVTHMTGQQTRSAGSVPLTPEPVFLEAAGPHS